jgi:predicted dehydrogenase
MPTQKHESSNTFRGNSGKVILVTLDPGHFHAALVQKSMYPHVSPRVFVYAPPGSDLEGHLQRITSFNQRSQNPTNWDEIVYSGDDYLEVMVREKPGNVMVTAGKNQKKTSYIKAAVDAGIHVLADKPMCIDWAGWELLKDAFESAACNGVLLYDVMTERYEITTILQKELVNTPLLFGELQTGSPEDPAVTMESTHYLLKTVAGSSLRRPAWYFDVNQQGEGIVDVSTHLVDLAMWECFPEQVIDYTHDIQIVQARRWPTMLDQSQFEQVTRHPHFPDYLVPQLNEQGLLPYYCNGHLTYTLRGIHVKISVVWEFQSGSGGGDTHYSAMRGSRSSVVIQQGEKQCYHPELYVQPAAGITQDSCGKILKEAIAGLESRYPGLAVEPDGAQWQVVIPDHYHVGHEAHFGQVTDKFLGYLVQGRLPDWEIPNMIAKYYTTTQALMLAKARRQCSTP